MIKKQITLTNKLGLHARAAMKLVNTACTFESDILLSYKNYQINAKSLLNVLSLGAPCGSTFKVEVSGADEEIAMKVIFNLIDSKFGEEE